MEHADARGLVSDWARGRLDAGLSREVEAHVRICRACSEAAEAAAGLEAEGRLAGATAGAHVSSDTLAAYVATPDAMSTGALARIGAHVRDCASCREEVALMRAAAVAPWWRAARSWFAVPGASARALQPALAVAVLLLAYPAWVGLVEYPRARGAAERQVQDAGARAQAPAGEPAAAAPAPRGGGVSALVLRGTTRGRDDVPELRLRTGQLLQPVLVDAAPAAPTVAVALVREPATRVWEAAGPREEFWDPVNSLVGLLVPADLLVPGTYRLELGAVPGGAPQVTARFRVLGPR